MSGLDFTTALSIVSACSELCELYSRITESHIIGAPVGDKHDAGALSREILVPTSLLPEIKELVKRIGSHTAEDTCVVSEDSASFINMGIKMLSEKLEEFEEKVLKGSLDNSLGNLDLNAVAVDLEENDIVKAVASLSKCIDDLPDIEKTSLPKICTVLPEGSPSKKFSFSPLPTSTSIRLVQMESRSFSYGSDMRLSFRTVDLSESPSFATLSYTWGKPFAVFRTAEERDAVEKYDIPIVCSGAVLGVGENLFRFLSQWQNALTHFEKRLQDKTLSEIEQAMGPPTQIWIDAICINQEDRAERNQQVSIMAQIYSTSTRTLIWLGEDDAFSKTGFRMIHSLATAPYKLSQVQAPPTDPEEICSLLGMPSTLSWSWFSVFALVNRSWFRRSWVVQEAALSPRPEFMCGSRLLPWAAVANACGFMAKTGIAERVTSFASLESSLTGMQFLFNDDVTQVDHREVERDPSKLNLYMSKELDEKLTMGTLVHLITQVRHANGALVSLDFEHPTFSKTSSVKSPVKGVPQSDRPQSVLTLWKLSRRTKCYDPRDKIFAFAHLAHRPCYKSAATNEARRDICIDYNSSVSDVFLQAAWFTLLSDSNLDLLSTARSISAQKHHGLPSWVPDWTADTGLGELQTFAPRLGWSPSGGRPWIIPENKFLYQPELRVEGMLVGSVRETGADKFKYPQAMALAGKLPSKYEHAPGEVSAFEVLWRTLILDSADGVSPAPEVLGFDMQCAHKNAFIQCCRDTVYGTSGDVDAYYEFVHEGSILSTFEQGKKKFEKIRPEGGGQEHTRDFENRVARLLHLRKLFITDSGHFGLADGHVAVQDKIFVVYGASTLLVLRPGSNGRFTLVGEAYVHGIMHGEFLESVESNAEKIILC